MYVDQEIEKLKESNQSGIYTKVAVVFIMCREPDKIAKFVKNYDAKTIFIDTKREIHTVTNNASDQNVRNYDYDIIIHNNGSLSDLSNIAKSFVDNMYDDSLKVGVYS
jgi:hypothetical protein